MTFIKPYSWLQCSLNSINMFFQTEYRCEKAQYKPSDSESRTNNTGLPVLYRTAGIWIFQWSPITTGVLMEHHQLRGSKKSSVFLQSGHYFSFVSPCHLLTLDPVNSIIQYNSLQYSHCTEEVLLIRWWLQWAGSFGSCLLKLDKNADPQNQTQAVENKGNTRIIL